MLGEPEALVTQPLGMLRELERATQRIRRRATLGHEREIEDRQRGHDAGALVGPRIRAQLRVEPLRELAGRRRKPTVRHGDPFVADL